MTKVSEKGFFVGLVIVACLVSLAGIFWAAFISGNSDDGGRGGAIAVGLSLFALFGTRNYAAEMYEAMTTNRGDSERRILKLTRPGQQPGTAPVKTDERVTALVARLQSEAEGQKLQNKCLALSSGVGTIAWGFGDVAAKALMACMAAGAH